MKRIPILPTIIVAAAVAVMIGLGVWQLQRAAWKDRMLAELAVAQSQPAVDLDPLFGGDEPSLPIAFRRALVTCAARDAEVSARAGRSRAGTAGYAFYVHCRPGEPGWAGRLQVNAGWSQRPDAVRRLSLSGTVAGIVGTAEPGEPIILTAAAGRGHSQQSPRLCRPMVLLRPRCRGDLRAGAEAAVGCGRGSETLSSAPP